MACSTSATADHQKRSTNSCSRSTSCAPNPTHGSCSAFLTRPRPRSALSAKTTSAATSITTNSGSSSIPTALGRRSSHASALAEESDAERHHTEAIELADALSPFERARTQLLYGEWLRRHRRRIDARRHLRAALATFEQHSAAPWADRARGELRASGESARKRNPSTRDQLTPQELNIAGLAADGLTNADIGAQLFLSPRTIDYHLRKVFAKLEIVSRADLASIELREPVSH